MSGLIDLDVIAGAKATHRYARLSASKARAVLNLVRDEDLGLARDRLRFCERGAAEVVSKVLESAVANATNNEQLDADELYVAECWADDGPVLKRWRPRARGRATRIFKQTCHITVIVAQLSTEELAMREARLAASGSRTASAARAARVAASRAAAAPAGADADAVESDAETAAAEPAAAEPAAEPSATESETAASDTAAAELSAAEVSDSVPAASEPSAAEPSAAEPSASEPKEGS
ncbi:50S ribosomal protein L22 [Candidatus Poriferisodalis sp.]|uniref:50S ribosomal protein L22 n=1 Tax=Candidatus Poriferisodalis sp. TaxID=3101277 RepID=UPI003B022C8B